MAATTGIGPIKQALVRALRDNLTLKAMVGADGINEGTEPRGSAYPHIVYSVAYATRDWDGTNVTIIVEMDVWSISDSQVEAHNLDQLVADSLEDVDLTAHLTTAGSEQTSLLCRRFGDLSSLDIDGAGNRVYQVGGLYRIWTDQQRTA